MREKKDTPLALWDEDENGDFLYPYEFIGWTISDSQSNQLSEGVQQKVETLQNDVITENSQHTNVVVDNTQKKVEKLQDTYTAEIQEKAVKLEIESIEENFQSGEMILLLTLFVSGKKHRFLTKVHRGSVEKGYNRFDDEDADVNSLYYLRGIRILQIQKIHSRQNPKNHKWLFDSSKIIESFNYFKYSMKLNNDFGSEMYKNIRFFLNQQLRK